MCAITGIFDVSGMVSKNQIAERNKRMHLRGPDDSGIFISSDGRVGLGHCRLALIDIENGAQPLFSSDGLQVIVFNGEIYNFREIRADLEMKGRVFKTKSDTEVLLEAYREYGIDGCLSRLEGMFAFAVYDAALGRLFIARDRFGEKPLFYTHDRRGRFEFASELKAFAPNLRKYSLDFDALNLFLSLTYIPAPFTIYREIRKLEPGRYLTVAADGSISETLYYDLAARLASAPPPSDFDCAKVELRDALENSVRTRMIADVPPGAFLSGGIDSGIVCCILSKLSSEPIDTFSIGFHEKEYDESERAQVVANHIGSRHHLYFLDYKDAVRELDELLDYYDEPFGDSSAIPSFYVAKKAREHVKFVLTGDCADEIFGGYEKYLGRHYVAKLRRVPACVRRAISFVVDRIPVTSRTSSFLRKAKKVLRNAECSDFELYYNLMCLGCNDGKRRTLLRDEVFRDVRSVVAARYDAYSPASNSAAGVLAREQFSDVRTVLEGDMLVKVDRACMKSSLENRAPFLETKILERALAYPDNFKIRGTQKKFILREAFRDLLPERTQNFPKSGFGVPVDYWLRNELRSDLEKMLSPEFLEKQGIFHSETVAKLMREHFAKKENHKNILWNLFVFQRWYLRAVDDSSILK